MKQKPMNTIAALVIAAQKASGGAAEHAASLGLVYSTQPLFDADIKAVLLARDNHLAAKGELTRKRAAHDGYLSGAIAWTTVARDLVKRKLGNKHSARWHDLGLKNSLRVPQYTDRLLAVIESFKAYFELHPELEVPQLNITAAGAKSMAEDLLARKNAVNAQLAVVKTLQSVRDEKRQVLHGRVRGAVKELSFHLGPMDPRWVAFGFNMPGAKEVPSTPENVTVEHVTNKTGSVKWEPSARADYYRVWAKVEGVDAELVPVGTPADPNFGFENLPANARIQVAVSAVNRGGESVKSAVVLLMTRPPAAAPQSLQPETGP